MGKSKLILVAAAIMVIAAAGVSNAEMGVGVMWQGSSIAPVLTLPILMSPGMIVEPFAGFHNQSTDTPESGSSAGANDLGIGFEGTRFTFGARLEKDMEEEGPTGLFGGHASVNMWSPDSDYLDSYMNIQFGAFVGGSAPLGDNLDLVGTMGVDLNLLGEQQNSDGDVVAPSVTRIDTFANFTMRWWVFGQE